MTVADYLPFGLQPLDLLTLMAGLTAFLVVLAVWNAAVSRDPMRGRVKALQARRNALISGLSTPKRRTSPVKKVNSVGLMRQIVQKFKLLQNEQAKKYSRLLAQAGWRSRDAIVIFMFFKIAMPFLIIITAMVFIYGFQVLSGRPMIELAVAAGSVILGFLGPEMAVKNQIHKRTDAIRKALPDALDLMVICAEAGLTLDAALNRVAKEMGQSSPELADEWGLAAIELGFLPDRRQALLNLSERIPLPSVRGVVTTLLQSEKYGTPLAASLRVLSAEFRNERMMKAEEKAARLPATMTVPLILFILPVLFVVLLGPATCRVADDFINR